jgi:CMP-N-acetylneuraminic acid synthetase
MSGRSSVNERAGVLAIVPARAGSKRLPGKNLLPVAGKPMIAWTLEAAMQSESIVDVLVTSDDDAVLAIARAMGVRHVVSRPAALAADDTTSAAVVSHALAHCAEAGLAYETLCLLQPTSPLRTAADIDGAVSLHRASGKPVVSVCETDHPLAWCVDVDTHGTIHRIETPLPSRAWRLNGAVYVIGVAAFLARPEFMPPGTLAYEMDRARSVDVDTLLDYRVCEALAGTMPGRSTRT